MDFLRKLFPMNSPVRKLWYFMKGFLAAKIHGNPARKIPVVGITGTDGKTTTIEMLSHILRTAAIPHIKISTVSIYLNGEEWDNASKRTTLSPMKTQKLLKEAVQSGSQIALLEVSSHALEQNRLYGIKVDVAAITNISEEHIDDHGGFVKYVMAKERLFSEYLKTTGLAVLSKDDKTITDWDVRIKAKKKWFSTHENHAADVLADSITAKKSGIEFRIQGNTVSIPIPGKFNAENALIAYIIANHLGLKPKEIIEALGSFRGVLGRLERVDFGQDFHIYIDFAVTPNAFRNVITSLKDITQGDLWVVFGCTGDRDRGKRSKMGEFAGNLADYVVLTDDEPYTEPAEFIREDVKHGIEQTDIWRGGDDSPHFWEIGDRKLAIEFALQRAKPGDSVLIPGMGAELSRNVGGKEIPWNDKEIVHDILLRKV